MLIACWAAKGGSGTTVVASSLALILAGRCEGATLVDLAGDIPAVLGLPDGDSPGVRDWCASDAGAEALSRLSISAGPTLQVIPAGLPPGRAGAASESDDLVRRRDLAAALAAISSPEHPVVVDCGTLGNCALRLAVASSATLSLLATRPCYLALRRALAAPIRPSAAVVVSEPGRSLGPGDVADVLGVPVCAVVPWDPAVARAVDGGLLGSRVPRVLRRSLRGAA